MPCELVGTIAMLLWWPEVSEITFGIYWLRIMVLLILMARFPGLPGWASSRKVWPIWILLKQETVSASGISWAICKSASRSRRITMPVPHLFKFFTGRVPFLPPNHQCQSTEGTQLDDDPSCTWQHGYYLHWGLVQPYFNCLCTAA